MTDRRVVEHVTCLGCGCTCDDITVTVAENRIVRAERACPLGVRWFGDGSVPDRVLVDGAPAEVDAALDRAAELLATGPGRTLVLLGLDLTTEAQRAALALADHLRAATDGPVSLSAASGILAAQRRGRATATLGEIRNRADLLVFWGVDPNERYPRYNSRYALDPAGTHLPGGRADRTVIAIDIGADRGPADADLRLALAPDDEESALGLMRAAVLGRAPEEFGTFTPMLQLARRLAGARYAVVVHDAEPSREARAPGRVEGLIALAQALNGPTRAALSTLRGGGNRSGAEAVSTWQTGFPFAVDFAPGYPLYRADRRGLARLVDGGFAAVLVAGVPAELDPSVAAALGAVRTVVIGPRASEAPFAPNVAVDTGVAGIHETGTAYRMDDVPLPLRAPLAAPRSAAKLLAALAARFAPEVVR